MAFFTTAAELTRRCDQNKNDIEEIYKQGKETNANVARLTTEVGILTTKVDNLHIEVGGLKTDVGDFKTRVEERFNRLERILAQPPEHEQSIRLLESKMNLYSRQTRNHNEELERLRQLVAAHDVRFDTLDGQMAEVLKILRAKSA